MIIKKIVGMTMAVLLAIQPLAVFDKIHSDIFYLFIIESIYL